MTTKTLRLTPPPSAKSVYLKGHEKFLKFVRENETPSAADREFYALVFDSLYFQAYESTSARRKRPPAPPYRKPGRSNELFRQRLEAYRTILITMADIDSMPRLTGHALRERMAWYFGVNWDQLRSRLNRLPEPHKSKWKKVFELPGKSER